MIVGTGLLANAFWNYEKDDDVIIFASGVSNSKEISQEEFLREEKLLNSYLEKYGRSKYFVYFSTCSMFDTYFERSAYTMHKINMEKIIIDKAVRHNIFRLPQVLGHNNKNQLIGFLFDAIKSQKEFDLFDIERNIIDISDIFLIVNRILQENIFVNKIVSIANPENCKVIELVHIIEKICLKEGRYKIIKKQGNFKIDMQEIQPIISKLQIFEKDYIENRIRKYYE